MDEEKTEIKIEKGVPIPPNSSGRVSKYPFTEMEIGDSIYIDAPPQKVRPSTQGFSSRHPEYRFVTRTEGKGVRVWRVKPKKP